MSEHWAIHPTRGSNNGRCGWYAHCENEGVHFASWSDAIAWATEHAGRGDGEDGYCPDCEGYMPTCGNLCIRCGAAT